PPHLPYRYTMDTTFRVCRACVTTSPQIYKSQGSAPASQSELSRLLIHTLTTPESLAFLESGRDILPGKTTVRPQCDHHRRVLVIYSCHDTDSRRVVDTRRVIKLSLVKVVTSRGTLP
ncbi:MAG: hypothetical protein MJE68_14325, partial [Proteobacteria bacterium]|nr:hypothetical protein [Pseudomonadota bacterium]